MIPKVEVYRVQGRWEWPNVHLVGEQCGRNKFKPRHWWMRTWQAEWDGCKRAPRAYTEWGVRRKAKKALLAWMDW